MRGEDCPLAVNHELATGSPPHAWGRRTISQIPEQFRRFTPTCVGKTVAITPRANLPSGSPPHAWGRLPSMRYTGGAIRFTPTCVGKTCGIQAFHHPCRGSPPHAWGRPKAEAIKLEHERFTPTCVGKTPLVGLDCRRIPVHPHMRGEDQVSGLDAPGAIGSPPHAWGRLCPCWTVKGWRRFTPTCVGKTETG